MEINKKTIYNLDRQADNNENYLLLYPKDVRKDISRTINSLGFLDKDLPDENFSKNIDKDYADIRAKLEKNNKDFKDLTSKYKDVLENLDYNISYKQKSKDFEENMAFGEKYFYFSAKVNDEDIEKLEDLRKKYPNTKVYKDNNNTNNNPKDKPKKDNKNRLDKESYLLVYPKKVEKDVSRSINTMGFVDYELDDNIKVKQVNDSYDQTLDRLDEINKEIDQIKSSYVDVTDNLAYSLNYQDKALELKNNMAKGDEYFYISGWVPESEIGKFEDLEKKHKHTTVTTKEVSKVSEVPPTKLKNNKVFRPFEYLVNMYGAPNYDEVDPTPFFAITYMILYGLMFGDLGQGLVFLALGFLLTKKNKVYGDLLKRIGISASVFGLMYGSFFGKEDLIPTLLIKPFDNVMTVLIASVIFGVSLMVISYIIGIYNKVKKQNDIEEGIFGKEGLAGLMMMLSFIIIVLNLVGKSIIPMAIGKIFLIISIIMIIFKKPIARKISGSKKLYDSSKSDYYIESSFSIIEALLSVFSNLVSFTRVGAFAINHVGLYMAFEVMANLTGGGFWGFIILLLGNILIIGLEGMIVFIQGLRLEFYEMFSKYYQGNGRLFRPINEK